MSYHWARILGCLRGAHPPPRFVYYSQLHHTVDGIWFQCGEDNRPLEIEYEDNRTYIVRLQHSGATPSHFRFGHAPCAQMQLESEADVVHLLRDALGIQMRTHKRIMTAP